MGIKALTNIRALTIEFSTYSSVDDAVVAVHSPAPLEAIVALLKRIELIEEAYAADPTIADISRTSIFVTGNNHVERYEFELTTDLANATYVALLVIPN